MGRTLVPNVASPFFGEGCARIADEAASRARQQLRMEECILIVPPERCYPRKDWFCTDGAAVVFFFKPQ